MKFEKEISELLDRANIAKETLDEDNQEKLTRAVDNLRLASQRDNGNENTIALITLGMKQLDSLLKLYEE